MLVFIQRITMNATVRSANLHKDVPSVSKCHAFLQKLSEYYNQAERASFTCKTWFTCKTIYIYVRFTSVHLVDVFKSHEA